MAHIKGAVSPAATRAVHDRVLRAQKAYVARLREGLDSLSSSIEEGDYEAVELCRAIESELSHIAYGSELVEV